MTARPTRPAPARSPGFSVVELLVAIALGAILLAGAVSLFVSNREAYNITSDLSRLQESARFALETMVRDIRMAGYFGCAADTSAIVDNTGGTDGDLWDPSFPIEGIDDFVAGGSTWLPTGHAPPSLAPDPNGVEPGTDAITVRYLDVRWPDHQVRNSTTTSVSVRSRTNFVPGGVAAVADCGAADVFLVPYGATADDVFTTEPDPDDATVTVDVIPVDGAISRTYDPDVNPVAAPLAGVRYYVARNEFGNPALFRHRIAAAASATDDPDETAEELFEGIADLQLLYGVDTNADRVPDSFVNAGAVTDWSSIVAVRIGILVQTVDPNRQPAEQTLPPLLDKTLGPYTGDALKLRRRVFVTTVQVRNL